MALGFGFLLGAARKTSGLPVFATFLLIIGGAVCALDAVKLKKKPLYLFFALFFLETGLYLLLFTLKVLPVTLAQSWPLLSVFAGVALLPGGWRRYGKIHARFLIPAVVFIILGCVLLIFSFKLAPFSLRRFILRWWPLVLAAIGLGLVLLSLPGGKPRPEPQHKDGRP
jgi:hypothetical protein